MTAAAEDAEKKPLLGAAGASAAPHDIEKSKAHSGDSAAKAPWKVLGLTMTPLIIIYYACMSGR